MSRESSQHRRATIISAAIALFRSKGLPQTSTRDLTEMLGISRSHIYHYFPSWQALCLAALEHYMTSDLQEAEKTVTGMPAEEALLRLAEWFLPDEVDPDWLIYADAWQISARDPSYRALAQKITADWNGLIGNVVTRGCDAGQFTCDNAAQAARQLGAAINGYADVLSLSQSDEGRRQALEDIYVLMRALLRLPGR